MIFDDEDYKAIWKDDAYTVELGAETIIRLRCTEEELIKKYGQTGYCFVDDMHEENRLSFLRYDYEYAPEAGSYEEDEYYRFHGIKRG